MVSVNETLPLNKQKCISAPMDMARVYAVVPVYNRVDKTQECISLLKQQTYEQICIVVVDGGSTDNTQQIVADRYPDVLIFSDNRELWWTDAMAYAMDRLIPLMNEKDYIFSVNSDTILSNDTVERLVRMSRLRNNANVAASVQEVGGRYIAAGARLTWGVSLSHPLGLDRDYADGSDEPLEADALFGRATLIPFHAFRRVGNFDCRRFPQYYGDTDFFFRATRAGMRCLIDRATLVYCVEDEANTGIHFVRSRKIAVKDLWSIAFSRRSNLNLLYGVRFVWKHAPWRWKLISMASILAKHVYQIFEIYGVNPVRTVWAALRVPSLPRAIRHVCEMQPKHLTFGELRKHGFDAQKMLRDGEIRPSGIPHTFHLAVSVKRMMNEWPTFRPLILRHYNPLVSCRVQRFARRIRRRQVLDPAHVAKDAQFRKEERTTSDV
jgi:GT2 family glycosyltransferase